MSAIGSHTGRGLAETVAEGQEGNHRTDATALPLLRLSAGGAVPTLKLLSSDPETTTCACHAQNSAAVTGPWCPSSSARTVRLCGLHNETSHWMSQQ